MRARTVKVTAFVLALFLIGSASVAADTLWGTFKGYSKVRLTMNGVEQKFDSSEVPAFTVDGTTVVPLRAVVERFNLIMNWDGDAQTVELYKPNVHMTIVRDFEKKSDYTMKAPFGLVGRGTTTSFFIFTTVDNLKADVSAIDWSVYSPSGKLVKSISREIEENPDSFWYPINMGDVSFDEKGVYTVRLSLRVTQSGTYYPVSEKQIVAD